MVAALALSAHQAMFRRPVRDSLIMQQVIRALHGKRQRELQRKKIDELTLQQLFNNFRYHHQTVSPHRVLQHQYQHLENHPYNGLEHLSERKLYPLSHLFAYEPLQANQLEHQQQRSKSISETNEFLRNYDPARRQHDKEDYYLRARAKERKEREEDELRGLIEGRVTGATGRESESESRSNVFNPLTSRQSRHSSESDSLLLADPMHRSRPWRKFRAAALATYFCVLLRTRLRKFITVRRQMCLQHGKIYVQQACFAMQTYYYTLLSPEIVQYILLLEKVSRCPKYNLDEDLLRVLTLIASKLNHSPVPKALLASLQLLTADYTFFNFGFLFETIISRLEVDEVWGCTVGVGKPESLMIAGCLMGIIMLCYNLLYRPWLAERLFRKGEKREFNTQRQYERVKGTIMKAGSVVYFTVLDSFVLTLDPIERDAKEFGQLVKEKRIRLVKEMPVVPSSLPDADNVDSELEEMRATVQSFRPDPMHQDETGMIPGQNRQFYERMKQLRGEAMALIADSLGQWITKATVSCLAETEKARKARAVKFTGRERGQAGQREK